MDDFTALIFASVSKIYLGELVEEARSIMTKRNEFGPIKPLHLRLAFTKLRNEGKLEFHSIDLKKLLG